MTKQEYKMISKLIDKNTSTKVISYYNYEDRYITEAGIKRLKQDIKDLFDEEGEE